MYEEENCSAQCCNTAVVSVRVNSVLMVQLMTKLSTLTVPVFLVHTHRTSSAFVGILQNRSVLLLSIYCFLPLLNGGSSFLSLYYLFLDMWWDAGMAIKQVLLLLLLDMCCGYLAMHISTFAY